MRMGRAQALSVALLFAQGGSDMTQQESVLGSPHADQDADFRNLKQAVQQN